MPKGTNKKAVNDDQSAFSQVVRLEFTEVKLGRIPEAQL